MFTNNRQPLSATAAGLTSNAADSPSELDRITKRLIFDDEEHLQEATPRANMPSKLVYSAPSKAIATGGLFLFDNDPFKLVVADDRNKENESTFAPSVRPQTFGFPERNKSQADVIENAGYVFNVAWSAPPGLPWSNEYKPAGNYYNQDYAALARDQVGCRMLQRELETNGRDFTLTVFDSVAMEFVELMVHPFGNYFCQKLIELLPAEQCDSIAIACLPCIADLAMNLHGTRALQKLIDAPLSRESQIAVVEAIIPFVLTLTRDSNGNHVVQKVLTNFEPELKQSIFDVLLSAFLDVSTDKHGCCVLQRGFDHGSQAQIAALLHLVIREVLRLVIDQYGNYVIQYVIENLPKSFDKVKEEIARKITTNALDLSRQKFASNVVEKCFIHVPSFRIDFTRKLLDNPTRLTSLLLDKFGNYVAQRVLNLAEGQEKKELLAILQSQRRALTASDFGGKIFAKLVKTFPSLSSDLPPPSEAPSLKKKAHSASDSKHVGYATWHSDRSGKHQ